MRTPRRRCAVVATASPSATAAPALVPAQHLGRHGNAHPLGLHARQARYRLPEWRFHHAAGGRKALRDPAAHRRPQGARKRYLAVQAPVQWQHLQSAPERKRTSSPTGSTAKTPHASFIWARASATASTSTIEAPAARHRTRTWSYTQRSPRDRGDHERDRPQRRGLARAVRLVGQHHQDGELQLDRQGGRRTDRSRGRARGDRGARQPA